MSHSRKHFLCIKDHSRSGCKYAKGLANRTIRRVSLDEEIPDGKAYRKYFESWDIHDWRFVNYYSKEEYGQNEWIQRFYKTYEDYLRTYYRK